jgi:hypothetical protein
MERVGVYVYGIVPGDVEVVPDTRGVGDPPGDVTLVRHGELAALVSEVDVDRPLGRPDDLKVHERLLDSTVAAGVPVLPVRFGAVLADEDAVTDELLAEHHDLFAAALEELDGRAEYVVHGRYVEETVLREVLAENGAAARLRDRLRDDPDQDLRIQLGEIVNSAIGAKRNADTGKVIELLRPHTVASSIREPVHEQDAVHVAFLVDLAAEQEFDDAVDALGRDWDGRVKLRLLGPLAPYDFVVTLRPD